MNKLEKIALTELSNHLFSIRERCKDENSERMNYERIFIRDDIKKAIDIIRAIEENDFNKTL